MSKANEAYEANQYEEAIRLASADLDENPEDIRSMFVLGGAFNRLQRPGLGRTVNKQCVELCPSPATWVELGHSYMLTYDLEEAKECLKKALSLDSRDFAALNNMSLVYMYDGQPDKALEYAKKALQIKDDWSAYENMGFAYLLKKDYKQGWPLYNMGLGRYEDRKARAYCEPTEPEWDGTKGQTVVAYGEQGLGDEIHFASVLPKFVKDCNVILECRGKLEGLFGRSFGVPTYGTLYAHDQTWPLQYKIDARIALSQLMGHYEYDGEPYLVPDPEKRKWWRAILDQYPGKKIGIAWNGGVQRTGSKLRSIPLEEFAPLAKLGTLVNLEYKDAKEDIKKFHVEHHTKVLDFSSLLGRDYDDTAALVAELDYVVCVTTAIVDLCGAIGQKCYALVPSKPHWKYGLEGDMFYKSVKCIRQQGSWTQTIRANLHRFRP